MAKKRGLGKGLEALLGSSASNLKDDLPPATSTTETKVSASSDEFQHLAIDVIQRGRYQPRTNFNLDALQELADSIKAHRANMNSLRANVVGVRLNLPSFMKFPQSFVILLTRNQWRLR